MAESAIKSLSEDFVHCNICTEPYKEPKMLPCLHSFCLQCLEGWANSRHGQPFSCPTCRCTVDLPSDGVSGLPHYFFMVSLMNRLEEIDRLSKEHKESNCSICNNKKGSMFCIDCKISMCRGCKETHNRLTRSDDHPLIPLEKLSDENFLQQVLSTQAPYCYTHKQEKVRYYCTQCSHLACQVCATVSHHGHQSLQEVDSTVSSVKAELEELLEKGEAKTSDARRNLEVTKTTIDDIERRTSELLRQVEARYDEIVVKLQTDKEKLTNEIRRIRDRECKPGKEVERQNSDWLKAMENTQEMTRTILQQNNSWDILEMKTKIADSLERLNSENLRMTRTSGMRNFSLIKTEIGVVNKSENQFEGNFIGRVRYSPTSLWHALKFNSSINYNF